MGFFYIYFCIFLCFFSDLSYYYLSYHSKNDRVQLWWWRTRSECDRGGLYRDNAVVIGEGLAGKRCLHVWCWGPTRLLWREARKVISCYVNIGHNWEHRIKIWTLWGLHNEASLWWRVSIITLSNTQTQVNVSDEGDFLRNMWVNVMENLAPVNKVRCCCHISANHRNVFTQISGIIVSHLARSRLKKSALLNTFR